MNILLINHYAGSPTHGMEYRPYELAKEWVMMGHDVTIVASSFSHLRMLNPKIIGKITTEKIDKIRYFWLETIPYKANNIYRVMNILQFAWDLMYLSRQIQSLANPDIVIASSPHPFIIYGARKIARMAKAKLVFEVRDLWPLTLLDIGKIPSWHPFIKLMQHAEDYAYKHSDAVVSLLPKADCYMKKHGMENEKFVYIPNGINVTHWEKLSSVIPLEHQEVLHGLKKEKRFIVGYVGTHGLANALDDLIAAAKKIQQYPICFVLVGQGTEKESLQQLVKQEKLSNVIFLPPVPRDSIPQLLDLMDALYIGWKREPLYRYGVSPNKLMDYMMAAKPVVHAIEAGNDLVVESGCGISVPPEDPECIAEAVFELYVSPSTKRQEMGAKGREFILKHHDYRVLARKFLKEIINK